MHSSEVRCGAENYVVLWPVLSQWWCGAKELSDSGDSMLLRHILEACGTLGLCDIDGLCSPGVNCLLLRVCHIGAVYYHGAVWRGSLVVLGDGVVLGLV